VSSRKWQQRIEDIIAAIREIKQFTQDIEFDEFERNPLLMKAVLYNFIIIGEAARNIPSEVQIVAPTIPWRLMGGMRNVVAHEYFQVDARRIWETAIDDLPTIVEPLINWTVRSSRLEEKY
jgi:uncharacterized protein with HEPN domain